MTFVKMQTFSTAKIIAINVVNLALDKLGEFRLHTNFGEASVLSVAVASVAILLSIVF